MPKSPAILLLVLATTVAPRAQGDDKPSPLAFGSTRAAGPARSFGPGQKGAAGKDRSSDRDRAYARGLIKKYDANNDRVLQEDEWRRIRGNPEKADSNADSRITYDELVARVTNKRREREVADPKTGDVRRSYRLTGAALPEGLPEWFVERDADGDGQVAMHEYSRRWTDSTARRFVGLDANDDGLITPAEALE